MPQSTLPAEILTAALEGLEAQRDRIRTQIAEVRRRLGGSPAAAPSGPEAPAQRTRRKMSPAARKRIAEAQRKRWEAFRKTSGTAPAPAKQTAKTAKTSPARKRKMSAAGRRRIAEATRKRWAEFRKKKAAGPKPNAKKKAGRKAAGQKRTTKVKGTKTAAVASEQAAGTPAASE